MRYVDRVNLDHVEHARTLIRACQHDLGYRLTDGERRDLLKDNTIWPNQEIDAIVEWIAIAEGD